MLNTKTKQNSITLKEPLKYKFEKRNKILWTTFDMNHSHVADKFVDTYFC